MENISTARANLVIKVFPAVASAFPSIEELVFELDRRGKFISRIASLNCSINRSPLVNLLIHFTLVWVCDFDFRRYAIANDLALEGDEDTDVFEQEESEQEAADWLLADSTLEEIREAILAQGKPDALNWDVFELYYYDQIMVSMVKTVQKMCHAAISMASRRSAAARRGCLGSVVIIAAALAFLVIWAKLSWAHGVLMFE